MVAVDSMIKCSPGVALRARADPFQSREVTLTVLTDNGMILGHDWVFFEPV